ncbi:MAG TPA: amino acid adenylation domain-containing protein, partial [Thermoanaerobaculia bacterium]|nr:amino acid adenylation domain-containing protein [Thermoanaerobaculia bacterium]
SRMLGDVKFHQHKSVDSATADRWRGRLSEESLGEPTRQLAAALGYSMDTRLAWLPLAAAAPAPGVPGAPAAPIPLSFAQERLWFLDQLEPGKPVYNIPLALRLTGPLDAAALARTFAEIAARHDVLRTRFPEASGRPVQEIDPVDPALGLDLPRVDLSALPAAAREREAGRLALQQARRVFNLARGPLIAATLLVLGPEEHALTTVMHHIVADGWSVDVLMREVAALYRAFAAGRPSPLPPLPIQYADYAVWQRRWLAGPVLDGLLGYWRGALAGSRPLQLPGDRPRPAMRSSRGGTRGFDLPAPLAADLLALARAHGATPYMALLAGYATLLARWSGEDDVVIGTPVANRTRAEVEDLIGFFVNTLALRVDLTVADAGGFGALLEQVRGVVLGAFAHQDLPFERLVEDLAPERNLARTPLVQVLFSFQNARGGGLRLPGLALTPLGLPGGSAKFDLTLTVGERRGGIGGIGGIGGGFEFSRDLFDEPTIDRLAGHLQALFAALVAAPDVPLSEATLLTAGERAQLLAWNDTARPIPGAGLATLFAETARRAPEAPALLAGGEVWSYAELTRRANRLAHHLRAIGVGPEVRVGVSLERSPELVVALLAVIKAGGAYMPVDADYPEERRALMLGDSCAAVLLTAIASDAPDAAAAGEGITVIDLTRDREAIARRSADDPADLAGPDNLAYVMYTSGSTGVPKGAAIPQRAVVRLVREARYVELTPADRVGQVSNASFDALTFEVWGALLSGACLVMIPRETVLTPALFAAELRRTGVTAMFLTVALFNQMAREEPGIFAGVSHLLVGGEAVDPGWARAVLADRPPRRLLNGYGPTETTTFAAWYEIREAPEGRPLPIGHPLGNTDLWVLDRAWQPLPVGVPGQLFIGGDGLARGYHARPALTAESFVPHALAAEVGRPGARLYATGDLVRRLPGGAIEYLGRIDRQVKLRGFRIEPGEIEVVLSSHPEVAANAVLVREDRPGDRRLVAYVAPDLDTAGLAAFLRGHLPEYMIPGVFVSLPALPLTPNGKIDRAALPAPERSAGGAESEGPRTPREQQVAAAWCEVLGLDRVGREEDFFALGGHSLRATQLVSRLRRDFEVDLAVRAVFERPTVAGLAEHLGELLAGVGAIGGIGGDGTTGFDEAPLVRRSGRAAASDLPLSFAQERLWFIDQLAPGSPMYNVTSALRLRGRLDVGVLEAVLAEILRRHESLRTRFVVHDGLPWQVIDPVPSGGLAAQIDLTALPAAVRKRTGDRLARREALRPFDLERGPLFRVVLLRLTVASDGEAEHALLLAMHHIVSDGWSKGVLTRELTTLYAAFLEGRPSPLPELEIQYADFALWQRRRLQGERLDAELAYWRDQLAGAPVLELPTDRPRPPVQSFRGGSRSLLLAPERGAALRQHCRDEGTTLFMTLLAAFDVLFQRASGQDDVVVGSVIANRNRAELEGLIGFFVNALALRVGLAGDPTFRGLLGQVREVVLGAFAHQDLPFEKLVAEIQPERDLSRSPLFQVAFVVQNAPATLLQLPGLAVVNAGSSEDAVEQTAKYDLLFTAVEHAGGGVRLSCSYAADLFEAATVARLLEHAAVLLDGVTAAPAARLSELPLLTPAELQQTLVEWNATASEVPAGVTVDRLFAEQARRTPEAVAVIAASETLTYRDLDQKAERLARRLRRSGVGPEVVVALGLERSPALVVAALAVLKAGGAYLPLDPANPAERLAFMIEDSGALLLITSARIRGRFPSGPEVLVVDFVDLVEGTPAEPALTEGPEPIRSAVDPANLAYVIYTSGSTG